MPARSAEYMDEMRERILVATLDCLESKGLANMSLTDVCNQAKISKGALYVHFGSKNELLCGVVDRAARRAPAKYNFTDAASLRDRLVAEFEFWSPEGLNTMYAEMELLAAGRTDDAIRDAIRRCQGVRFELFRAGIRGLRKRGELRDDVSDQAASLAVTCFYEGVVVLAFHTRQSRDIHLEAVHGLLAGLLKPKVLRELMATATAA